MTRARRGPAGPATAPRPFRQTRSEDALLLGPEGRGLRRRVVGIPSRARIPGAETALTAPALNRLPPEGPTGVSAGPPAARLRTTLGLRTVNLVATVRPL